MLRENPDRFAAEIIDCLAQGSRPTAFLLGAGCPVSVKGAAGQPLIPDIAGLTKAVVTTLEKGENSEPWGRLLSTLTEDGIEEPNVEEMLSRVRGLREHVGQGTVRDLAAQDLQRLEDAICAEVVRVVRVDLPAELTAFHHLAAWAGATERSVPVEIFTTNYDLLLEQALEHRQIPFFDGFVGAHRPFFDLFAVEGDLLPARWARVWKIHGSINWQRVQAGDGFRIWRAEGGGAEVIHPSHLKYDQSRKMPYLAMMDRLRAFLRSPSAVLLTCGYSFGDQHLNDVIAQGLRGNASAVVLGLKRGTLPGAGAARDIASMCTNFRLHARDGALVGGRELRWAEAQEDPGATASPSAVRWISPPTEGGHWKAEFLLGDFAQLGSLLEEVAGKRRGPGETNAG